jgi:hypothetical protein
MVYTIQRPDGNFGPYTLEQLRSFSQAGQAYPQDLVWPQGSASPVSLGELLRSAQSDGTGGLIPYKNGAALTSYYLAVGSLIPCIGLLLGIPAFILGLKGLKKAKAEPWVRGQAHAWIGIILGGLMTLVNLAGLVMVAVTMIAERRH